MRGPDYLALLERFHSDLCPRTYVEIGVNKGDSVRLASAPTDSLGIDPVPKLTTRPSNTAILEMTSATAFESGAVDAWLDGRPIELAFIDGLHQFETALGDFIEVERRCTRDSVVLLHDCLPESPEWAGKSPETIAWTGDVWKVVVALLRYRADLSVRVIDTPPSGLAVISRLDPTATTLVDKSGEILERIGGLEWADYLYELQSWPIGESDLDTAVSGDS